MAHIQQLGGHVGQLGDGGGLNPLKHRLEHVALAVGTHQVGVDLTDTGVGQSLSAGQRLHTGALHLADVALALLLHPLDVLVQLAQLTGLDVDLHTADIIDDVHKLHEVDVHILGDVHIEIGVDGLDGRLGAGALIIRLGEILDAVIVEVGVLRFAVAVVKGVGQLGAAGGVAQIIILAVALHVHQGVASQRGHLDAGIICIAAVDGEDDDGVGVEGLAVAQSIIEFPGIASFIQTKESNILNTRGGQRGVDVQLILLGGIKLIVNIGVVLYQIGGVEINDTQEDGQHRNARHHDEGNTQTQFLFGQFSLFLSGGFSAQLLLVHSAQADVAQRGTAGRAGRALSLNGFTAMFAYHK